MDRLGRKKAYGPLTSHVTLPESEFNAHSFSISAARRSRSRRRIFGTVSGSRNRGTSGGWATGERFDAVLIVRFAFDENSPLESPFGVHIDSDTVQTAGYFWVS